MIRSGLSVIKYCRVIAHYRLLSHSGNLRLPLLLRAAGYILDLLSLRLPFVTPRHDFGTRLCKALISLGPIYIKLGQTLATRPDLIGIDLAERLSHLQDKLPPFPFAHVASEFSKQFGAEPETVFQSINHQPVAAASIAQVHKAILLSGEMVAVKILRPGIEKEYRANLALLSKAAALIEKYYPYYNRLKLSSVLEIFNKTMEQELDLRMEAAAASELRDDFITSEEIYIPQVYWQYTTKTIMTSEWVEGISLYEVDKLKASGHNTKELAKKIAVAFFQQAYQNGFFHADLHPGNILVKNDGKIALLDFGIMGRLDRSNRLAVSEILAAFIARKYTRIAAIHRDMGYIPTNTDLQMFAQSFRAIAEPILGKAAKDISIGRLLTHLFKITEEYGMETQPQLILLQKTTVVVEGIGKMLDPEVNLWLLAEPWIKEWAKENISIEAKLADAAAYYIKQFFKL